METASPCDVPTYFFSPLFIWNARLTLSPKVYLAPLSHPVPGNPKHRKPASSIDPKGNSRQHRTVGTPTKESHTQHREQTHTGPVIFFLFFSYYNLVYLFYFFLRQRATSLIFWPRGEDDWVAKHACRFRFSLPVSFSLFLLLLSCITSLKRKADQVQKSLRKSGSRDTYEVWEQR